MSEMKKGTVSAEVRSDTDKSPIAISETAKEQKPKILVYVGPTIAGVASHGMIFNNGLSKELNAAMEKAPAFNGLVVPVMELSKAIKEIERELGATYVLYNKVVNYRP